MKSIEGPETIRQELPDILHDESRFESGTPDFVCFPETAEKLREQILKALHEEKTITFIGAQTGTTGGAVPVDGTVAIAFSAMARIHEVRWDDENHPVLVCDPGITLDEIETYLRTPDASGYTVPGSERLGNDKWFYPPDPTEMTAQLGGTVATNASGARSYRYGPTRNHIAFLDMILPSGDTITFDRYDGSDQWDAVITTDQGNRISLPVPKYESPQTKNASGYYNRQPLHSIDLFIGSEGTLGAYSRIGIRLSERPKILSGLTFFPSGEKAFDFADFLRKEPDVAAIEFFDRGSLAFINQYRERMPAKFPVFPEGCSAAILWEYIEKEHGAFEEEMERWEEQLDACDSSFEITWSGFDESEKKKLHSFRHALPETVNCIIAENKRSYPDIRKIGTDSAFPAAVFRNKWNEMITLIENASLMYAAFGHLGDYHIHINLIPGNTYELNIAREVYKKLMAIAIEAGGTVSAEHGIGKIKPAYLAAMYGEEGIAEMKRLKCTLDPEWLFNPGNLFAE
jgi:D-lactate dehydrogenase (cytochrome)